MSLYGLCMVSTDMTRINKGSRDPQQSLRLLKGSATEMFENFCLLDISFPSNWRPVSDYEVAL